MNSSKSGPCLAIGLAVATALLTACTTPSPVRVDRDPAVDLSQYQTFAWFTPPADAKPATPPSSTNKSENKGELGPATPDTTLQENRLRAAIAAALQAKGYRQDDSKPDFHISYAFNVFQKPKNSGFSIGVGAGGGSGNVSGGVGVSLPLGKRTNLIGALTLDVIDTARNTQVWTATYQSKVSDPLDDATARQLADTILEKYPPAAHK
jgi:hypothetical protein